MSGAQCGRVQCGGWGVSMADLRCAIRSSAESILEYEECRKNDLPPPSPSDTPLKSRLFPLDSAPQGRHTSMIAVRNVGDAIIILHVVAYGLLPKLNNTGSKSRSNSRLPRRGASDVPSHSRTYCRWKDCFVELDDMTHAGILRHFLGFHRMPRGLPTRCEWGPGCRSEKMGFPQLTSPDIS